MTLVSIIIPTLNSASLISEIFHKIKEQKTSHDIELSIIDSGSTDDTLKIIQSFSNELKIIITKIPNKEFNHGTARNLAIKQSHGNFLALLTHDSIPLNEFWLENLVKPFDDPQVAGVFGRHLPRDDCNPIERRDLIEFFNGFGNEDITYQLKDKKNPLQEYEKNKHILGFFSSNNACLRRTVWEKIPYKKVEILGEDQLWARDILLAGYKKVYTPNAIVIHSHNYSPFKAFQRWVDDYRFYKQFHNYNEYSSFWKTLATACKLSKDNCNYIKNNETKYAIKKWKNYGRWIAFSRVFAEYVAGKWEKIPNVFKPYLSMNEKQRRV